ncbi:MAG: hypothetical protein ACRD0X_07085 [Thermoanaerobaculia bacterium]
MQTISISPAFIARMKASGAEIESAGNGDWRQELDQATERVRSDPGAFGEGVTFVSAEPIGTDEAPGVRLTLAFADITRVDLGQVQGLGGPAPPRAESGGEQDLRFRLDRHPGGRAVLTAVFTEPPAEPRPAAAAPVPKVGPKAGPGAKGIEDLGKGLLEMFKAMATGMRIALAVEVPELVATNSPYVEGDTVTLLELDMDSLLADEAKLTAFGESADTSLAALRKLFAGVPGVKLPPEPEVTIEFKD